MVKLRQRRQMSWKRILQVPSYYTHAQLPEFIAIAHETVITLFSFLLHFVSCSDTGKIIKNLTQNKAPGDEGIKSIGLKNLTNKATHCLHSTSISGIHQHNLCSHCLEKGQNHNISQTRKDPSLPANSSATSPYKHSANFLNN
jgi:hypothetical protein